MNSSGNDYSKLYRLQDKFLSWWQTLNFPFYLTGGTALGRFYLNHRYSDDLDFFVNNNDRYQHYVSIFKKEIAANFRINIQQSLFTDDFSRVFIAEEESLLKIELVNDIEYRVGEPENYLYGKIDTPINILSNKLSAVIGRDEPKDIFDIIHIALNYSFNWKDIFDHAKRKVVINELDVEQRLSSFPTEWLKNVNWIETTKDHIELGEMLHQIADDFLLGGSNTLGKNKLPIEKARPAIKEPDETTSTERKN